MCNKTKNAGFTLVEVLVAVVIVGLVLTAIAAAISFSVKNSSQADYRQVATRYAQDAIDIIRQKRATDGWNSFYSTYLPPSGQSRCLQSNGKLTSTPCAAWNTNGTNYTRVIKVDKTTGTATITVTVSWQDGSATRDVTVVQKLFDY